MILWLNSDGKNFGNREGKIEIAPADNKTVNRGGKITVNSSNKTTYTDSRVDEISARIERLKASLLNDGLRGSKAQEEHVNVESGSIKTQSNTDNSEPSVDEGGAEIKKVGAELLDKEVKDYKAEAVADEPKAVEVKKLEEDDKFFDEKPSEYNKSQTYSVGFDTPTRLDSVPTQRVNGPVFAKRKRSIYSKLEKKDFPFVYLLILFPVAQFLIFWLYVNASSIGLAFQDGTGAFTFHNFKMVHQGFVDKDMLGINLTDSLLRSFTLWFCGEIFCFPVTLITTYVLTRKVFGHYFFRICYIIPSLMGAIIWTLLIKEMVSYNGPITQLIKSLGVELHPRVLKGGLLAHETTAFPTILTIRILMGFVGNNAVLTGAYTRVPTELFESAQLDGADFGTELFRIAIPCISPTICTLLTFSLCSVFTSDYNVWLFTNGSGNYNTSTIGFQLFNLTYILSNQGTGSTGGYGYPAALGVTLTALTMPIVIVGKHLLEKIFANVEV